MTQNSTAAGDQATGHLVQMLMPIRTEYQQEDRHYLNQLREELAHTFGGVTAYLRAPAVGDWKDESNRIEQDQIVVVEVMVEELSLEWWAELRERIRCDLEQDELMIRALPYLRM